MASHDFCRLATQGCGGKNQMTNRRKRSLGVGEATPSRVAATVNLIGVQCRGIARILLELDAQAGRQPGTLRTAGDRQHVVAGHFAAAQGRVIDFSVNVGPF